MPDSVKRVSVRIAGVAYQLAASEDEAHIRKMAAQADEMIRQVLLASPQLNQSTATILALVNAMDDVNKARSQAAALASEKDVLTQQASQLRTELDRVREQNFAMRRDQLQLQRLVAEYERRFEQIVQAAAEQGKDPDSLEDAVGRMDPDTAEPLDRCEIDTVHSEATDSTASADKATPLTLTSYQQSRLEDFI